MKIICPICNKEHEKRNGDYNRALKLKVPLYCSKACAGVARRHNKSKNQLILEKAEYDKNYREKNHDILKVKKAIDFKKRYDPDQARIERKKRYKQHLEYLNTPKYKSWKIEYDKKYLAKKKYGEFADCALILRDIHAEIDNRTIKQEQGLINKSIKRKRQWKN